jgi:hypothetical protein
MPTPYAWAWRLPPRGAGQVDHSTFEYDGLGEVVSTVAADDDGTGDDLHTVVGYTDCPATHLHQPITMTATAAGKVLRHREANLDCATGPRRTTTLSMFRCGTRSTPTATPPPTPTTGSAG